MEKRKKKLKKTIDLMVKNTLERMKYVTAEDRYHLLCEWGEIIFCDWTTEEILMVPNFVQGSEEVEK